MGSQAQQGLADKVFPLAGIPPIPVPSWDDQLSTRVQNDLAWRLFPQRLEELGSAIEELSGEWNTKDVTNAILFLRFEVVATFFLFIALDTYSVYHNSERLRLEYLQTQDAEGEIHGRDCCNPGTQ